MPTPGEPYDGADRSDPVAPRRMLANVRARLFGGAPAPLRIGPYEIVGQLGHGAMGTVFEAWDERLQRRVAVKAVPMPPGARDRRNAVVREAQALARLDHPSVVTVFDAGTDGFGAWVAMELLRGRDLQGWAHGRPDVTTTVAVLREAGEGLAAVHDAALVHRDVKPSNVFRTDDARVCLVDFGLAVTTDEDELDRGGAGTPAYMAPEQHRGERVTAASDQYAFAVMAWEMLYGVRPFAASDPAGLYRRKLGVALPVQPLRADVPPAVHRILRRALHPDAQRRWESMRALLGALDAAVAPPRRTRTWAPAASAVVLVGAWAWSTPGAGACPRDLPSPWTDDERLAIRDALLGDGTVLRRDTWERVQTALDDRAAALVLAQRDTCSAADHGAIDGRLADLRLACLAQARSAFSALTESLHDGDLDVVTSAVGWVAELDDPARCLALERTAAAVLLEPPASIANAVTLQRELLARAPAAARRGDHDTALGIADAVVEVAEELEFTPLLAEAQFERGRVHRGRREWDLAAARLDAAYFEAAAIRHTGVEIDAALEMVALLAGNLGRADEAWTWLGRARAADDGSRVPVTAGLLAYEGMILSATGDYDAAAARWFDALAIARTLGEDHPAYTSIAPNTILALNNTGRYAEAHELGGDILEARVRQLGAEHPSLAAPLHNFAIAAWELGQLEAAYAALERSIALERTWRGARSYDVGSGLFELGRRLLLEGRTAEAMPRLTEAAEILEHTVGPEHPATVSCIVACGEGELASGHRDAATAHFERARVLAETTFGADHEYVGWALVGKARIDLDDERWSTARVGLERAWAILAPLEQLDEASVELGEVALMLAETRWRTGARTQAIEVLASVRPSAEAEHPVVQAQRARIVAWQRAHAHADTEDSP